MEFFIQILFELFGELFLQLFVELLFRPLFPESPTLKLHVEDSPLTNALIFGGIGAICGGVSLLLFPLHLIRDPIFQLVNLLATPLLLGATVSLLGRRRLKKGLEPFPIDKFLYGFSFAGAFAVVRYLGGR